MSLNSQKILGVRITSDPKDVILEEMRKYLVYGLGNRGQRIQKSQKPFVIVTPNSEQIVLAAKEKRFADILNRADVALPDGVGPVIASQFLRPVAVTGKRLIIKRRIPGVEFMEDLVHLAVERGVRIGLIGGTAGLAVKALECLRTRYPALRGWAEDGPDVYIVNQGIRIMNQGKKTTASSMIRDSHPMMLSSVDADAYFVQLAGRIIQTQTQVLFVGLGAPKQEYYAARLARQFQISNLKFRIVVMSVGGSFDIITGRLKRAPLLIRSIGFEWFWRLFQEPWRWRRQQALVQFATLVLREMIRKS